VDKKINGEITLKLYHLPQGSSGRLLLTIGFHTALVAPWCCCRASLSFDAAPTPPPELHSMVVFKEEDIPDNQLKATLDEHFAIHLLFGRTLPSDDQEEGGGGGGCSEMTMTTASLPCEEQHAAYPCMHLKCSNPNCGVMIQVDRAGNHASNSPSNRGVEDIRHSNASARCSSSRRKFKSHERRSPSGHSEVVCDRCGQSNKVPVSFSSHESVQSQDASVQAGIRATNEIEQTRQHLEIQQQITSIMASSSAASSTPTESRNPGISREDGASAAAVETEVDLLARELCEMFPDHSLRSIKSTIQKVPNPRENLNRVLDLLMDEPAGEHENSATLSDSDVNTDASNGHMTHHTVEETTFPLVPFALQNGIAVRTAYGDGTIHSYDFSCDGHVEVVVRLNWGGLLHMRQVVGIEAPMEELMGLNRAFLERPAEVQETGSSVEAADDVPPCCLFLMFMISIVSMSTFLLIFCFGMLMSIF
jgi:hypothetical protein